ncbi:MAG: hypothetical protein AAF288_05400 [Planctomycetota bacterium]
MDKRTRIGAGVAAVAVAALLIDQVLLLPASEPGVGPAASAAASSSPQTSAVSQAGPAVTPQVEGDPSDAEQALRLGVARALSAWEARAVSGDDPDPLVPPSVWQIVSIDTATGRPAQTVAPPEFAVDGVITGSGQDMAVVRGKLVRPGQEYEGWRLVSIRGQRVVFEQDGVAHELIAAPTPQLDAP